MTVIRRVALFVLLCCGVSTTPLQITGNSVTTQPTCQCAPDPTATTNCMPYDSQMQAYTLDEAMLSFPDLSLDHNASAPEMPVEDLSTCTTDECMDCREKIRGKLKQVGLLPSMITDALTDVNNNVTSQTICQRYRFTRPDGGTREYGEKHGKDSDSDEDDDDEKEKRKNKRKNKDKNRHRRQTTTGGTTGGAVMTLDPNVIGTRFSLSCTSKGVSQDTSGLVSLCSSCWVWRKLPDNYSPQYINELVCDDTDGACLSGYASCSVGHRTVEVMRNDNGAMTRVALQSGSYCECRVATGSALQSLVTGGGLASAIPPAIVTP